jgi:hypothetical protein
VQSQKNTVV